MKHKGLSIVEVILAVSIFSMIAVTGISTIVYSFTVNRRGEEEVVATALAEEGLEAVASLRNRSYSNIVAGTWDVSASSGTWQFTAPVPSPASYTRTLTVSSGLRDGGGSIVNSGGTSDPDTWKVVADVTWPFKTGSNRSVSLTSYFTNYEKSIGFSEDGLLLYNDTTTAPIWRSYNSGTNTFSNEQSGPTGASGRTFMLRTSPIKSEAIGGYVTSGGVLRVLCFDGITWSEDWTVSVGGTGTTRRFDIGYETNTGDVLVLYSTNTGTTNELAYRTKAGSSGCGSANWGSTTVFNPLRTSGIVQWVKAAWDRRASSNLISFAWADANRDLSVSVWDGNGFTNEPTAVSETNLEIVTAAQDVDSFDIEYESSSGDIMLVWGNSAGTNGTNGVRYRVCTGGTSACSWGGVTTPPTFADDATNLDISSHPNTNEIVFASIGNAGSDLQTGYWSGTAWTNTANRDTSCATPIAGSAFVASGWLVSGATSRSIITFYDSAATNIGWVVGSSSTFTVQSDQPVSPSFATQRWYDIQLSSSLTNELMFLISNSANDFFAKRLVMTSTPTFTWTASDGGTVLEATMAQATTSPYSFAYMRN